MQDSGEISLKGGRSAQGIVRIGNTVHRPIGKYPDFVHSLLKLLEEKNFQYSPRFLGIDEQGREILTFIEGIVPHGELNLSQDNLIQFAKALRSFHDATFRSELAGTSEVICHNDFAPWNMVLNNGVLAGVIDFDDATPGERLDDLAYFIWTSTGLGNNSSVEEQGRKMKVICHAYGLSDKKGLIENIVKQQEKILKKRKFLSQHDVSDGARDFSKSKIESIREEIVWVKKNATNLEKYL